MDTAPQAWRFVPLAAPLVVGAALMLAIAGFALKPPRVRGGVWLAVLTVCLSVYALGYAAEIGSAELVSVRRWLSVQYLGIAIVPVFVLLVVLSSTGRERLVTPLLVTMLCALPATTCVLAWTDAGRDWIWRDLAVDSAGEYTRTRFKPGPWYLVHNAYVHLLLLTALLLLRRSLATASGVFRRQLLVLLCGCALPILVHIAYLAGAFGAGFDPNPYAQILSALALAWGMLESQLWDLVPVAREAVIASQRDAVLVVDSRDRLVELNPSALELVGADKARALARPIGDLLPAWHALVASRSSEEAFRTAVALRVKDQDRFFDASVAPLRRGQGALEGRLLVLRDVTERRQAEALQDTLVKTMVHDLRNPLTVVSAALEMLAHESRSLPEQTTSLLEMARANTRRLIDLVSTILDYQRLRSGRMPLSCAPLDLVDLALEAISLQRPLAEAKDQRLETGPDERMPRVDADRELILRVLQNLIGNSLKFAPRGGTIRVEFRPTQGHVEVAVSDDGPGIPDELKRRLFSEFVTGSGDGRGTGLGLAFCRLAVEAHGGQISAANRAGGGATFTFSLPAMS